MDSDEDARPVYRLLHVTSQQRQQHAAAAVAGDVSNIYRSDLSTVRRACWAGPGLPAWLDKRELFVTDVLLVPSSAAIARVMSRLPFGNADGPPAQRIGDASNDVENIRRSGSVRAETGKRVQARSDLKQHLTARCWHSQRQS